MSTTVSDQLPQRLSGRVHRPADILACGQDASHEAQHLPQSPRMALHGGRL